MAGMLADAVQNRGAALGLANPALYAAADTSAYNDITKTDLPAYPGAVRSDYVNGVNASDGYSYTARYSTRTARSRFTSGRATTM